MATPTVSRPTFRKSTDCTRAGTNEPKTQDGLPQSGARETHGEAPREGAHAVWSAEPPRVLAAARREGSRTRCRAMENQGRRGKRQLSLGEVLPLRPGRAGGISRASCRGVWRAPRVADQRDRRDDRDG